MLTDTHCHLYFNNYDKDRDAVLARAWQAGVERILVPGIDLPSSRAAIELAEAYSQVYAAVGVHPNSATTWDAGSLAALTELAAHPKVVAIGEIGLDYYRDRAPRSLQKRVFREQIELAGQADLSIIIHTRNTSPNDRSCFTDIVEIIEEMRDELSDDYPGVFHSFLESEPEAHQALELGFFIGITGPVTFKNATELRNVVASTALEKLLIETDGPFLTPHPHRGKRNEPAHVYYVSEKIAQLRGESPRSIAKITSDNAANLFRWRNSD
ncbi:MAG: TatD family hydrolase [Anaerolineales bacterium]|nr:TatD family hydrolase [Chloroflexota bacterium]MBL6982594.1 TatD family hydrolase [Anaerolineales bacterium]